MGLGLGRRTYGDLIGYGVLAEDVTLDHFRLGRFGDICHAFGKDCIAVVCAAIASKESNKSLSRSSQSLYLLLLAVHAADGRAWDESTNIPKRQALYLISILHAHLN